MSEYYGLSQEIADYVIHEMCLNKDKIILNNCQNYYYEQVLEEVEKILQLGLKK